jgi:anti-sigma B factor antagonist
LDLLETQGDRLIVDLSDVTYIDSSALGMLIALAARLGDRGASLAIISGREGLRRIFQTRGLVDLLGFAESLDEAATHLDSARPGSS